MNRALISTTYEEGDNINELLASIDRQSVAPDQCIFVDAGSSDNTVERLKQFAERVGFPVTIRVEEGCNIAAGRNLAIEEANAEVIAVTDAGVELNKQWFESITDPLMSNDVVDVVAGHYLPQAESTFQRCAARFAYVPGSDIDAETFDPSSRSIAFRKGAWRTVGGYPEDLVFAEDTQFDRSLRDDGYTFVFEPAAVVYWDHSTSFHDFARRQWMYAYWGSIAGISGGRPFVLLRVISALTLLTLAAVTGELWPLALVAAGVGCIVALDLRRIHDIDVDAASFSKEIPTMAVLRVTNDVLTAAGFVAGTITRVLGRREKA
jgi:glycosyltransferase involved in cell wall biosynthesis